MAPAPATASPPALRRTLADELGKIVGPAGVITDPGRLLPYESDGLTAYRHAPRAVVLPRDTEETAAVLRRLHEAGLPVVPRGAGTGLSGGALALDGAVVVGTARMDRILHLDPINRRARVQAGVVNAVLSARARPHGLLYAPDPSSQTACTLGGNVAENSGGPHCLKYGVTSRYVRGLTLVLADGRVLAAGGAERDPTGYDLAGLVVGSEGCFGMVTEIEVGLVPVPEDVRTLLAIFDDIEDAGRAVTRIIASGLLPAALEIIDGETIRAVEASVFAAGYPVDAEAALVVEFDGTGAGLDEEAGAAAACCREEGARAVRSAADEAERTALWKGRKKAFGAMGRIAPDLLVQDATVPRSRLPEVLGRIREIADRHGLTVANVFHAGDGNLHPNILFDRRRPEQVEIVERASREIMTVCVEAGGTITGEHGVGVDKRAYMRLVHGEEELRAMAAVKEAFDPKGRMNPGKVLPDGVEPFRPVPAGRPVGAEGSEGDAVPAPREPRRLVEELLGPEGVGEGDRPDSPPLALPRSPEEAAEILRAASAEGLTVRLEGRGTWPEGRGAPSGAELVVSTRRMDRILQYEPADLTLTAEAGLTLSALAEVTGQAGQWLAVDPPGHAGGTLGATVATASGGFFATRYGSIRDLVLGVTLVTGDGRLLRLGGRVVKNVAGFDLVRLVAGSWGSLGLICEATVRLHPLPGAVVRLEARAEKLEALGPAARAVAASPVVPAAVELREAPLPDGGREALLAVTLHGSPGAVRSEADALRARVEALVERPEPPEAPEPAREPDLVVRFRQPSGELGGLVEIARTLGRLEGGRNVLDGAPLLLRADPLGGSLRVVVPNVRTDGEWAERWALRLEDLRRTLEARDGGLTVEAAPAALAGRVAARKAPQGVEAELMGALRDRFDPGRTLARGRFTF